MRFSHFFVDRPIFAGVMSIIITLVGYISFRALPITEFPEIAPPTVTVNATYAGASAEVIAATVASPIEQEINGVDDMLYVISQSTGDGALSISVVFKPGTNVDQAQVLVQNRVSVALPRLPDEVQRVGVTVRKKSPDLMLVIHLISPDGSLDQQYISNYATINIKDVSRASTAWATPRVRRARLFDAGLARSRQGAARGLTADDVVTALRAPTSRSRPAPSISRRRHRRRASSSRCRRSAGCRPPEQFQRHRGGDRRRRPGHARARHRAGRARLARLYDQRLSRRPGATAIAIFQRPGSNALADRRQRASPTMDRLAQSFPARTGDIGSSTIPTEFIPAVDQRGHSDPLRGGRPGGPRGPRSSCRPGARR